LALLLFALGRGVWRFGQDRKDARKQDSVALKSHLTTASLSKTFPAIRESLAVRAEFSPASRQIKGREVKGVVPKSEPASIADAKPDFNPSFATFDKFRQIKFNKGKGILPRGSSTSFKPFFPADYADPFVIEGGGIKIAVRPLNADGAKAETVEGKVVYRDIHRDTDALHTAANNRSEEFLVLRTSDAPTRFEYEISEAEGVTRVESRDGGLRFIGADGRGLQIEAPWVIDAKGRRDVKAVFWEIGTRAANEAQRLSLVLNPENLTYPLVIDPTWVYFGPPILFRLSHTETLLPNGEVLIAGGATSGGDDRNSEVYDPRTGKSSFTNMNIARSDHTATLLDNGLALVAGGDISSTVKNTAELYNPTTRTWTRTRNMLVGRRRHTATPLLDGKVLVVGGSSSSADAELYDPAGGTWQLTEKPAILRPYAHTATRLLDGRVLVAGGGNEPTTNSFLATNIAEIYDPKTGKWSLAGSLKEKRGYHTATLLPDGKVLAVGGYEVLSDTGVFEGKKTAEIYDPATNAWILTASMSVPRVGHAATLLSNSKVLIAGGYPNSAEDATRKTEIYDPATGAWSATGDLNEGRVTSRTSEAIRLFDGKVLMIGEGTYSAELYDPSTGVWREIRSLSEWRDLPSATLLPNNKVLIAGGYDLSKNINSAEIFDPASSVWTVTGQLNTARRAHTATLLPDGKKVLVVGGAGNAGNLAGAELFDIETGKWMLTGSLSIPRAGHSATLLSNGKVLVAGGFSGSARLMTAEVYDPATGSWAPTDNLKSTRTLHSAVALRDGRVLVVGGDGPNNFLNTAEIYNPITGEWTVTGNLKTGRELLEAILLNDGKVLVIGGFNNGFLDSAELYDPSTGLWSPAGNLKVGRVYHSATLLPSGRVLVVGGRRENDGKPENYFKSVEIYDPVTGSWSEGGDLNVGRSGHRAVLLPNNNVLVAGGWDGIGYKAGFSTEIYQSLPDLQVADFPLPLEVLTETPFDLRWTVKNAGDKTASGPWTDKIYISTDSNLSGNDTLVGSYPFDGSLNPGQTAERIQNVTLPRLSIPQDGNYHFIVVTDSENKVDETPFEGNNLRAKPVVIKRKPLPDLVVVPDSIQAPATAFFDQTIRVQWTVKNIGAASTDAGEWQDWVYLSSDDIPELEDPFKTQVQNVSYLSVGESYVGSADIRIPRGLVGTYNVLIYTDFARGFFREDPFNVIEDNEKNNRRAKPITISAPPLPDLQVASVAASPDEVFAGQQLFLNWRIENKGTGSTPPDQAAWSDGIYLSKDTTFDPATDRLIGSRPRSGGLVKDDGYSVSSFGVNVPNVEGDWYVFVVADYQNNVYEFNNEGNNANYDRRRPVKIKVPPLDLIVESFTAPATGTAARPITVNWKIKNRGIEDRPASWFDTVYISNEEKFDPAKATPLTTVAQNVRIQAGSIHDGSAQVTLPACNAGRFYLFVFTDSRDSLFEYDPDGKAEVNNFSEPKPIQINAIPPDLQVAEGISFPATGNAGQPISVTWKVENRGDGPTIENGWTDSLYLSASPTLNANSALLLGSFRREGNLDKDASYTRTENVVVPVRAQGLYHLFVFTDAGDGVEECAGDGDNTRAGTTTIKIDNKLPDFKITAINFTAPVLSGQTINLSWTGQNAGTAEAKNSAWNDKVYLSSKSTLDGSERLLATKLINGPLAINATYNAQAQVTIPSIPTSDYFLIVASDADNFVFEGQFETNNTDSRPVRIQSPDVDLRVTVVDAPGQGFSGLQIPVSWTVSNAGAAQTFASQWTDRVFISRDRILDPTDRAIGYRVREGALNGGASYNATLNVEIPAGLSGPYYIFVRTDEHNAVAENNKDNNTAHDATPVTLQLTPPVDLIVTAVNPPPSGTPGEDATINWTVVNQSNNEVRGRWTDAVYLSSDKVWDINDAEIGRVDRDGPLAGQATYTATLTAKLPPVTPGNYYVIVRTDVRNRVREENESNNTTASSGAMTVDVPALTLGVPTNSTIQTGQERFFKVNAPGNETLRFALDGQNPLTSNELFARFGLLPSRSAFDFSFSRPYEPDQEIVVPDTQTGTYYSLARGAFVPDNSDLFSIKAEILPFGITSVSPNRIGDNGQVTITIKGAKFEDVSTVRLVKGSTTLTAATVWLIDSGTLKARFFLRDSSNGTYTAQAINSTNRIAQMDGGLTIEKATIPKISLSVSGDAEPRLNRRTTDFGVLENKGNIDVPYLFLFGSVDADTQIRWSRPQSSLPRISMANPGDANLSNISGTTMAQFIVRNLEVGQRAEFSMSYEAFGSEWVCPT
jgi:subtilase family serine protease/N-acetylneuraminic acid mutarotase